ncbi:MAG: glycosyltransferase family 1 protein [Acidimicrobiales bacterium]|nr:glycosyltransferase family 1 protein [Acidimicrobiales bacterium]
MATTPLRVLLDSRMATWTGVGRYTTGLARAVAARPDIELIQVVTAGEGTPEAARDGSVATQITASKHPFTLGGARELSRIAREVDPDVTHCPHFPTPLPAVHPLVVTMHDLTPLLVPGVMPSVAKRAAYRWWNHRAVSVSDQIITDAGFTLCEIERVFPHATGRITAIPLGVDDFVAGAAGQLPEHLAALTSAPYVLSMGSTRRHKDLPTLLSAFAIVAPLRPELRLLLVGTEEPGYLSVTLPDATPAIRQRISFTGAVDDAALRALMTGAEVFAFPSRYEGYGLPPLEAMALGTPAVVAEAASLPEVVGDGALTFEPGDAFGLSARIEELLYDASLRERMSAAGLTRASELTWESTADATEAVYRRAVARQS